MTQTFPMLPGECWWGGCVNQGHLMPLNEKSRVLMDPFHGRENDQFAPLYVSSKGRYLWRERPYTLRAENGVMTCEGAGEAVLSEDRKSVV